MLRAVVCLFVSGFLQNAIAQAPPPPQQQSQSSTLVIAFGSSTMGESDEFLGDDRGPSRESGGETFSITFRDARTLSQIKILSVSTSGHGKILVHNAETETSSQSEAQPITEFENAMLAAGELRQATPAEAVKKITFQIEGYSSDDASAKIELTSDIEILPSDFIIHRERPTADGNYGTFVDENLYADFTHTDILTLIDGGQAVRASELQQTSWVCSAYHYGPEFRPSKYIDEKNRYYYRDGDLLRSITNLSENDTGWFDTEQGLSSESFDRPICNTDIPSRLLYKKTVSGNLIGELTGSLTHLYKACYGSSRDYLDTYFYGSKLGIDKQFVFIYEFCRPAELP